MVPGANTVCGCPRLSCTDASVILTKSGIISPRTGVYLYASFSCPKLCPLKQVQTYPDSSTIYYLHYFAFYFFYIPHFAMSQQDAFIMWKQLIIQRFKHCQSRLALPSLIVLRAGLCFNPKSAVKVVFTPMAVLISVRVWHLSSCPNIWDTKWSYVLYLLQNLSLLCLVILLCKMCQGISSRICFISGLLLLLSPVIVPYLWSFVTSKVIGVIYLFWLPDYSVFLFQLLVDKK